MDQTLLSDPICDASAKYRTFDGTCNNLRVPKWGSAGTPLQRIIPNAYSDGFFLPRTGSDRFPLPSARFISNTVLGTASRPASFSTVLPAFGQFLIHDMELVPVSDGQLLFGIYLD